MSLASRKHGCSYEHPCSESKYGQTVHLVMEDNPKIVSLFDIRIPHDDPIPLPHKVIRATITPSLIYTPFF